jgi:hypothetical protein
MDRVSQRGALFSAELYSRLRTPNPVWKSKLSADAVNFEQNAAGPKQLGFGFVNPGNARKPVPKYASNCGLLGDMLQQRLLKEAAH